MTDQDLPAEPDAAATEPGPGGGTPDVGTPEPDAAPPEDADDGRRQLRQEAKRYRLALRDAEAERDALRDRLDSHDRMEAERAVAGLMADPADLWLTAQLADLRGEDGSLDLEAVKAAAGKAVEDRPHWRKAGPDFDAGFRPAPGGGGPSFSASLKRAVTGR